MNKNTLQGTRGHIGHACISAERPRLDFCMKRVLLDCPGFNASFLFNKRPKILPGRFM